MIAIAAKNVTKRFETTIAVNNASIEVCKGEIRGLVGENGSGKTTLVSIISGILRCDDGTMEKDGKHYKPEGVIDANKHGVSIILQDMSTIDGLTIAQNIFFGLEKRFSKGGFLNLRKMNASAKELLEKYGLKDVDLGADISTLYFEERKLTEFAKALYTNPDVLIVDETTSALSQSSRGLLFDIIHDFKKDGKSVIFITHELHEVLEHCDTVTIMRDGAVVGTYDINELDENKIKTLMVGREFIEGYKYYRKDMEYTYNDEVVFKVENLTKKGAFYEIEFELHRGEILGIGGLTNSGMHDLGRVLFGIEKAELGKVICCQNSKLVEVKSARDAIKNKIAYVSKNRDQESLMLTSSIMDNIVLPGIDLLNRATFISPRKKRKYAEENTKQLSVKMSNIEQMVIYLSGGNKQKVAISKWLANRSDLFILDCPTRGIDVAVKAVIYDIMQNLKAERCSLIMISEELPELIGMSDRIIVMKQGKISNIVERGKNFKEEYLLNYMI